MPKYLHHVIITILLIIIILLHSICDCWPCPSSPLQYVFCELHPLEIGSVKNFNHFTIWIVSCHYEEHKNCKQLQRHYLHIVSLIICTDEIFMCEHFEEVRHCCCQRREMQARTHTDDNITTNSDTCLHPYGTPNLAFVSIWI